MTLNYVPGLRLESARFYGETGHFKLNFSIENSNFSQFFVSGIHIHTFSHNFAGKKISFHRHFKALCQVTTMSENFSSAMISSETSETDGMESRPEF